MHQGRVVYRSKVFLAGLNSLLAALLLTFFWGPANLYGDPWNPRQARVNLFSLPLEDVLTIPVSDHPSLEVRSQGIYLLSANEINKLGDSQAGARVNRRRGRRTLFLFIDGYIAGPVTFDDIVATVHHYGRKVSHVEAYLGRSAHRWIPGRGSVVNIVLNSPGEEEDTASQSRSEGVQP